VRPRVSAEFKGLRDKLKEHLEIVLEERGALSERELWEEALGFFSPQLRKYADKFRIVYRKVYGRKIGRKTAELNVLDNLRRLLSEIKKEILHTEKQVIVGRKRYGRIFYAKGREGEIGKKVREIVEKAGGRAKEVLDAVKNGPLPVDPSHKKAVEMLEYYGLVETRKIGKKVYAVEPGFREIEVEIKKTKGLFPEHFTVFKPFKTEVLIIRNGPEKLKLKFDAAAWDPVNRLFYLALVRDYVDVKAVDEFLKKYFLLRVPAKLVIFCKSISEKAREKAKSWGINVTVIGQ